MAADDTNGVLKPATFTDAAGASATIERISWEPGTVKLKLSPHTGIAGHIVDFIAFDGTTSLSLNTDAAAVDAANESLSWSVPSQPWDDGDELMLRIREVRGTLPPTGGTPPGKAMFALFLLLGLLATLRRNGRRASVEMRDFDKRQYTNRDHTSNVGQPRQPAETAAQKQPAHRLHPARPPRPRRKRPRQPRTSGLRNTVAHVGADDGYKDRIMLRDFGHTLGLHEFYADTTMDHTMDNLNAVMNTCYCEPQAYDIVALMALYQSR